MMNKFRHIFQQSSISVEVRLLMELIRSIREKSPLLVLYGSPTEGNWLGIANATRGLYPDNSIEIPQWYSNCRLNKKEQEQVIQAIERANFERILISGFAPYFFDWIEKLHESTSVDILYHGTISEWHDPAQRAIVKKLIRYGNERKIGEFRFVKKGLEEVFRSLFGLKSSHQPLALPVLPSDLIKPELDRTKIHIGVFGSDTFNKNLHNQVVHALMIPNTIVHVLDAAHFEYLGMADRIVGHGKHLPREEFLGILGSMDLNLYMSFNESWGLVAKESEMLGVPCVNSIEMNYSDIIISSITH